MDATFDLERYCPRCDAVTLWTADKYGPERLACMNLPPTVWEGEGWSRRPKEFSTVPCGFTLADGLSGLELERLRRRHQLDEHKPVERGYRFV